MLKFFVLNIFKNIHIEKLKPFLKVYRKNLMGTTCDRLYSLCRRQDMKFLTRIGNKHFSYFIAIETFSNALCKFDTSC